MAEATQLPVPTGEVVVGERTIEAPPARYAMFGRALARWTRGLRDIAASAGLPFAGEEDPDLPAERAEKLGGDIRACLEARGGEVLARAQAANIAGTYLALSATGRGRFFTLLAKEFGVDRQRLDEAIEVYWGASDGPARLAAQRGLRRALVTPAMRLLTKFNALPDGMKLLVEMRAHLLALESEDADLRALDADFRHLLATWFDVGFLSRQRLTWESPASLLEKIIEYEAVHEVRSWADLRHRLDGDRRCYAFFHPSLPREPLIFVQVALVEGLAGAIGPLLDERRPPLEPRRADTAIFYSITNTLYGLRGISFGNFLIKQVVDDLARDLPNLRQFATLSPMPRFRTWLAGRPEDEWLPDEARGAVAERLDGAADPIELLARPDWLQDPDLRRALEPPLIRAAARYLADRGTDGMPVDPVARFHLGNGARIERLNWQADDSPRRLEQSAGMMVNYLYHPADIEPNHEAFASRRLVTVAPAIHDLLKDAPKEMAAGLRVSRRSGLGRMMRRG